MSTASSIKPQYRIVILSGPGRGTAYQLASSQISIGREKDNDIVIAEDVRLSRHHARVEILGDQVQVVDVSQKNKIAVNNQRLERVALKEGMTFTIGATEMRLERLSDFTPPPSSEPDLQLVSPNIPEVVDMRRPPQAPPPPAHPAAFGGVPPIAPQARRPAPRPPQRKSYVIHIIIAVIVVGGAYFFFDQGGVKRKGDSLRTNEDVESTIAEAQKEKDAIRKRTEKLGDNYPEAQALYVQGFRDYKKGQYSRAIESFRGALAIYSNHQLAQRYLKLSYRRLDELIQFNMIQGRQYRSRQMFDKCVSAFTNVINLSLDRNSPTFKEAKELREECDLKLEGRY